MNLRPRFELRVGITGHRPPRLDSNQVRRIHEQLLAIFVAIRAELAKIHVEKSEYFSEAPPRLVLISPLAAGADSIAAQAALEAGAELEACLPFGPDRYREDFNAEQRPIFEDLLGKAQRVMSLPGEEMSGNEAYRAVGTLTLAQCDLLLAVWDGEPAAGVGGTSEVIEEAVADHTPVIIVDADAETAPQLIWSGSDAEPHDMPTIETITPIAADAVLDRLVHALTLPPPSARRGLLHFLEGLPTQHLRPLGYPLLQFVTRARGLRSAFTVPTEEQSADQIRPMLKTFAPATACAEPVEALLSARFAAADTAANRFALKYRSGFISNFLMAALAVMLSLSGLIMPKLKVFFIVAELLTICLIILRTRKASRAGWHRRWIDTRQLAELLRILALSSALGNLSLRRRGDTSEPSGWPGWYARATAREVGMPPVHLSIEHTGLVRDSALQMIAEQRTYHRRNAHRMEKMDHWLRHVGEGLFVVTIITCVGWLVTKMTIGVERDLWGAGMTQIVTFLSAMLPAVGAALYGIRMQGDFAAAAERSLSINRQLDRLSVAIQRDQLDNRRLASRLRRLAEIMLSEIDQWQQMSEVRPLELPG